MKLFLETALKKNYAVVLDKGIPLKVIEFSQADQILPEIEKMKLDLSLIEAIIVGTGPGSYTGVRMGVVVAESLGFALKIPVLGVSSLKIFARPEGLPVVTDARVGGFYVLKGEEPEVLSKQEVELFKTILTPEIDTLPKKLPGLNIIETKPDWNRFASLVNNLEPNPIEILYLRKTQAENEWIKRVED